MKGEGVKKLRLHWGYLDGDWVVGDFETAEEAVAACGAEMGMSMESGRRVRVAAWQEVGDQVRAAGELVIER